MRKFAGDDYEVLAQTAYPLPDCPDSYHAEGFASAYAVQALASLYPSHSEVQECLIIGDNSSILSYWRRTARVRRPAPVTVLHQAQLIAATELPQISWRYVPLNVPVANPDDPGSLTLSRIKPAVSDLTSLGDESRRFSSAIQALETSLQAFVFPWSEPFFGAVTTLGYPFGMMKLAGFKVRPWIPHEPEVQRIFGEYLGRLTTKTLALPLQLKTAVSLPVSPYDALVVKHVHRKGANAHQKRWSRRGQERATCLAWP